MFVFLHPFPEGRRKRQHGKKMNHKQHIKDQLKELLREKNLNYKELKKTQPTWLKCWKRHVVLGSEVASGRRTHLLVSSTDLAEHLDLEWAMRTSRFWGDLFILYRGAGDWPHLRLDWGFWLREDVEDGRLLERKPEDQEKEPAVQDELEQPSTTCVIPQAVWILYFLPHDKEKDDAEIFLSAKSVLKWENVVMYFVTNGKSL